MLGYTTSITITMTSTAVATAMTPVLQAAKEGWWASSLLGGALVLLAIVPLAMLYSTRRHALFNPARTTVAVKVLLVPLVLLLLLILTINLSLFIESMSMIFYPQTPELVLGGLFLLPVVYAVIGGVEVIERMNWLILLFATLFTLLLPWLLSNQVQESYLLPLFGRGWMPIAKGSLLPFSWFTDAALVTLLIKWLPRPYRKRLQPLLIGVGLGLFFYMLVFLLTVLTLSARLTERILFPIITAVRDISIADFIERLDPLINAVWTMTMMAKIAVLLFLLTAALQWLLQLQVRGPLTVPLAVLLLVGSLMFSNITTCLELYLYGWVGVAALLLLTLYLLAFATPSERK